MADRGRGVTTHPLHWIRMLSMTHAIDLGWGDVRDGESSSWELGGIKIRGGGTILRTLFCLHYLPA